jgi:hypothetical protein
MSYLVYHYFFVYCSLSHCSCSLFFLVLILFFLEYVALVKVRYQASDGAMLLVFFFVFLVRVRYQVSDGLNGEFFSIGWTLIGLVFSKQTKIALSWEGSDDFNGEFCFHWLDFDWTSFSNQTKTALSWEGFFSQLLCLLVGVAFAKVMTMKKRLALHPLGAFFHQRKGSICWWWGIGFGLFM